MLHVRAVGAGLAMTGALDHDGGRTLLHALETTEGDVRIDASCVLKVDGAGLTALAVARIRCRADGRAFVLTAIAPEAVEGLRAGDQLRALFAGPSVVETSAPESVHASTDGRAAPSVRAVRRRRRFPIHRHRHQGM
jgi:ABC-type transporter Mla MlaB component